MARISILLQNNLISAIAMYLCSIKTREILGNPSLMPKRFPETLRPLDISRVEVNLEGRGGNFPITPEFWWSMAILFRECTG